MSRRHYYREQAAALEAISGILWERCATPPERGEETAKAAPASESVEPEVGRLERMRLEAARMTQTDRFAPVGQVLDGVLALFQEKTHQQNLRVHVALPGSRSGGDARSGAAEADAHSHAGLPARARPRLPRCTLSAESQSEELGFHADRGAVLRAPSDAAF